MVEEKGEVGSSFLQSGTCKEPQPDTEVVILQKLSYP